MNAENINITTGCVACTYADAYGRSCQFGSLFPLLVWMTGEKCPNTKPKTKEQKEEQAYLHKALELALSN